MNSKLFFRMLSPCSLGLLLALWCGCGASVAAQNFQINPIFHCVDVDRSTNTVTAYFGYESFEREVSDVLVGTNNRFLPDPPDRGQPIHYFPGLHERAFRLTFATNSFLLWSFLGTSISATVESQPCTPPPQPVVADIVPFVESVTVNGTTATATFGYHNASGNTINLAAGSAQNRLSQVSTQSPPEEFLSGFRRNVFSVSFPSNQVLYWQVQGLPAIAVPGGAASCPPISIRVR